MKKFNDLFEQSRKLSETELSEIDLDTIHNLGISKTQTDLLGSHTAVTYPPLDSLQEIDGDLVFRQLSFLNDIDAYFHVPFCGYPCEFCPYTTLNIFGRGSEAISPYLEALKKEISTWANRIGGSRVRSLFIGGGTPFALPEKNLADLLQYAKDKIPFIDSSEICVETDPRATIKEDAARKLEILKQYGTTRMSIGIQTFDFESLRNSARTFRGHAATDEERAVRILMESGIPNINVDMIQDLPLGTVEYFDRLKNDLETIGRLKPHHVTWYNMRLRPEAAYSKRLEIERVQEKESLLGRLIIWNFMDSIGYIVLEGDRFALRENYEDSFRKTRGSVETDLIGMGVSAYSHVANQGIFQNPRVIGGPVRADSKKATEQYMQKISEKGHAITYGYPLSPDEMLAGKLVLGLKKGVNHEELHDYMLTPVWRCYSTFVIEPTMRLIDAGLLEVSENKIGFTRTGRLFENEICAQFYTPNAIYDAHERRGTLTPEISERSESYNGSKLTDEIASEQVPLSHR